MVIRDTRYGVYSANQASDFPQRPQRIQRNKRKAWGKAAWGLEPRLWWCPLWWPCSEHLPHCRPQHFLLSRDGLGILCLFTCLLWRLAVFFLPRGRCLDKTVGPCIIRGYHMKTLSQENSPKSSEKESRGLQLKRTWIILVSAPTNNFLPNISPRREISFLLSHWKHSWLSSGFCFLAVFADVKKWQRGRITLLQNN